MQVVSLRTISSAVGLKIKATMFNQMATELLMAVPAEWHAALQGGLVAVNGGVLRHAIGSSRGQIAAHLIPIGPSDFVQSTLGSVAGFLPLAATQFAVVGLVAVSFHTLNTKIDDVSKSLRRLESKFDDQRWAIIAGAIDQLRRIEREGRDSSIWNDLTGVRKELSASAAYHLRRLAPNKDAIKVSYANFQSQKFKDASREAIADLIALSMSRSSLGRALLMEGAFRSAHHEMAEAQKEVHQAAGVIASGLIHHVVKHHEHWFGSNDHRKLVTHVTSSIESSGPIGALEVVADELNRPSEWYDSPLSLRMQSTWKDDGLSDDAQFLLNLAGEASAKEVSYRQCLENQTTPDSFLNYVGQQRILAPGAG